MESRDLSVPVNFPRCLADTHWGDQTLLNTIILTAAPKEIRSLGQSIYGFYHIKFTPVDIMLELESQSCRQQDGSSSTTTVPSSQFTTYTDFFNHVKDFLLATTDHHDLVYQGIDKDWAKAVLDTLDKNFEGRNFRKHYNSRSKSLWFRIMPTEIHDCHQDWVHNQKREWFRANLLTTNEDDYLGTRVGTTTEFVGGPYAGSRKEADLFIRPDTTKYPTFVIESCWSESYPQLENDMSLWLVGSQGNCNPVIIIKWTKSDTNNTVKGNLEIYTKDRQGMPHLSQSEVIFPRPPNPQAVAQQVSVTRRMLFGSHVFPGSNLNDVFDLSLNSLRDLATDSLRAMNLAPA